MSNSQEQNKLPYDTFVKNENDIRGLVAYSLYKAGKIEKEIELDGQDLSTATRNKKIKEWQQDALLESRVNHYFDCADSYLSDYLNKYTNKFPWFKNVLSGVIASLSVTMIAVIASIGIAAYNKFNPVELLKEAANKSASTLTSSEIKEGFSLKEENNKVFVISKENESLLYCPSCYLEVDKESDFCKHCGNKLTK